MWDTRVITCIINNGIYCLIKSTENVVARYIHINRSVPKLKVRVNPRAQSQFKTYTRYDDIDFIQHKELSKLLAEAEDLPSILHPESFP